MQKLIPRWKYLLVFALLMAWVFAALNRDLSDYGVFTSSAKAWLRGETHLYDGKVAFYYAPWTMAVLAPFSLLPERLGQFLFNTLSLAALVWATWTFIRPAPWWALAIALINSYTAWLIFTGQWDAIVLASLALAWLSIQNGPMNRWSPWLLGIALVGLSTKPTNVVLPVLLILYAALRWPKKDLAGAMAPLALVFAASLPIAGWDWPVRYVWFLQAYPNPSTYKLLTPWGSAEYTISVWGNITPVHQMLFLALLVGAVMWQVKVIRKGINRENVLALLSINIAGSPYILVYHMIYLAPVTGWILAQNLRLGFALALVAILDLVLLFLGQGILLYPLAVFLGMMLCLRSASHSV